MQYGPRAARFLVKESISLIAFAADEPGTCEVLAPFDLEVRANRDFDSGF
jgi:hypothetical protein